MNPIQLVERTTAQLYKIERSGSLLTTPIGLYFMPDDDLQGDLDTGNVIVTDRPKLPNLASWIRRSDVLVMIDGLNQLLEITRREEP